MGFANPDFIWSLSELARCKRLSSMKAAQAGVSGAEYRESGRLNLTLLTPAAILRPGAEVHFSRAAQTTPASENASIGNGEPAYRKSGFLPGHHWRSNDRRHRRAGQDGSAPGCDPARQPFFI
jgi:hypothetical protein